MVVYHHWVGKDLRQDGPQGRRGAVACGQQVDVAGRAVRLGVPHGEEGRPAQDKPLPVRGYAQPVQEPLVEVAREHQRHIVPGGLRVVTQLLLQGGRRVPLPLALSRFRAVIAHTIRLSRYGRMTVATRQMVA